ncbi:HlyU family transcriptional regulator [Halomonas sp. CUBES01]|uniref:HlyU family transcriptional regulator n=1 Tax=Vreelandella gomseomensis TaxID=370766 RepID=A0ABU1GD40_9GAMM|nr:MULTISPECIES: HlyU family transcriptional regulator [Halomonas]MDR5874964.1 HlyU family transcriptional regulator [Halomonas gomseomensis]MEC4767230.1 HlyU family transcriptional regulator [Halomonas sp. CUBES01]
MFKKLFSGLLGGGSDGATSQSQAAEPVEYKGYLITSQPDSQSGQYRVSGTIRRSQGEGDDLEHRFERSDMVPSREACDALMVSKSQRYIDEVGDDMFAPDPRHEGNG